MALLDDRVAELMEEAHAAAFSGGDMRLAARKWAEVLALDPHHAEARTLLEKARSTLRSSSSVATPAAPASTSTRQPSVPVKHAEECAALVSCARAYQAEGDVAGAVQLVGMALDLHPDSPDAAAFLRQNEATLVRMFETRLGGADRTCSTDLSTEDLQMLVLPPRARDLMLLVDGTTPVSTLVAVSGMRKLEALCWLDHLHRLGVIRG